MFSRGAQRRLVRQLTPQFAVGMPYRAGTIES